MCLLADSTAAASKWGTSAIKFLAPWSGEELHIQTRSLHNLQVLTLLPFVIDIKEILQHTLSTPH
jgi:hypothetical protein